MCYFAIRVSGVHDDDDGLERRFAAFGSTVLVHFDIHRGCYLVVYKTRQDAENAVRELGHGNEGLTCAALFDHAHERVLKSRASDYARVLFNSYCSY